METDMDDNERILKQIEELMKQREFSRYKLAKDSGINNSTLTTILNERSTISIQNLTKICQALGVSRADFFALLDRYAEKPGEDNLSTIEWEMLPPKFKIATKAIMKVFEELYQ